MLYTEDATERPHCRGCAKRPAPMVGRASLYMPTGSASLVTFAEHDDAGPIPHHWADLLDPVTAVPLPAGHSHARRDTGEVETALHARGWRVATRGEAAAALRAEGYRLGTDRGPGHVLYADQADTVTWLSEFQGYLRSAFVVRTALPAGRFVQYLPPHMTPSPEHLADMTETFHLAGCPMVERLDQSPFAGQPIVVLGGMVMWLADHRGALPVRAPHATRLNTMLWITGHDENGRPDWSCPGTPDLYALDTPEKHEGSEYQPCYVGWDLLLAAAGTG